MLSDFEGEVMVGRMQQMSVRIGEVKAAVFLHLRRVCLQVLAKTGVTAVMCQ